MKLCPSLDGMDPAAPNPYDELAYVGRAYPETHPDRLATIGTLYGLTPAPVDRCRVLEIGCGDAANLLPLAYTLPESEFLGIDLAAQPIARGREQAADLGLRNVRLEAMDILDFPADAGTFDYIVAHGVYSWTPPAVRDAVLKLCGRHLAPQGIAFVSFNALPGYHLREMERRMMLYHVGRVGGGTKEQQARQALSLLRFLSDAQPDDNPYKKILEGAFDSLGQRLQTAAGVAWFHHDILAEVNQPFYLHEFVERAEDQGMQFLGEATFRLAKSAQYPPAVMAAFDQLGGDLLTQEQYMDFISCAPFRRVLLCRREARLDRSIGPERVAGLSARGDLQPVQGNSSGAETPEAPERFKGPDGEITLNHPLAKAAVRLLGQAWPHGYAVADLLTAARAAGGSDGSAAELSQLLVTLYGGGMVELSTQTAASVLTVSERPEVSALVRWQIERSPVITTLRHTNGALEGAYIRRLVRLLDGTRDRTAVLGELRGWVESGEAARECARCVDGNGTPEAVPEADQLATTLEESLRRLARLELLIR